MRGTQSFSFSSMMSARIIPAYAGNTNPFDSVCLIFTDHPRLCGEHLTPLAEIIGNVGSSPLMRGTPDLHRVFRIKLGIIPAYAGNTGMYIGQGLASGDHPRLCGEHHVCFLLVGDFPGSSPLMRGTPSHNFQPRIISRIIPAYAGNT